MPEVRMLCDAACPGLRAVRCLPSSRVSLDPRRFSPETSIARVAMDKKRIRSFMVVTVDVFSIDDPLCGQNISMMSRDLLEFYAVGVDEEKEPFCGENANSGDSELEP